MVSKNSAAARTFAGTIRIERSALRPVAAVKAALGVVIPLMIGLAVHQPAAGAAASFGALTVGVAIITAGPRTPVRTLLAASVGIGAATFLGSVAGLVPAAHLVLLAVFGFLAGLLVAAGSGATSVGVNATVALLIFGRIAAGPELAAPHASWVLAGGLLETALAVLLRSPRPLQVQREALAAGYEALALAATSRGLPELIVAETAGAHALASHLADAKSQVAVPGAAIIAGQLDDAMAELAGSVRDGRKPAELPELRQSQLKLAAASAQCLTPTDRRGAILAALLDPLVDSVDTAASLLATLRYQPT